MIVDRHAVGAIDARHLHVAVRGVAPQAGPDADRMDAQPGFIGGFERISRGIVDAIGKQNDRLHVAPRHLLRGDRDRLSQRSRGPSGARVFNS